MNILGSALRRIAVRTTENAITGTANSVLEYGRSIPPTVEPLPTGETVRKNVIQFTAMNLLTLLPFVGGIIWLALLYQAIKTFFKKRTYVLKEDYVKKADKRYKMGYRIDGTTQVKDVDNPIYYNEEQRYLILLEGSLKLGILLLFGVIAGIVLYTLTKSK